MQKRKWSMAIGALCVAVAYGGVQQAWAADAGQAERIATAVTNAAADRAAFVGGARTDDAALAATVGGQEVRVSKDPAGYVTTARPDGNTVKLRLPDVGAREAVQTENGTVVYAGRDVSTAVQVRTDGGVRALVSLANDKAPKSYAFTFDLPEGFIIEPTASADGGLVVTAAEGAVVVGSIGAPWAKDATGRLLPTSYEVNGSTIVQHIDTTNAVYPVVADPYLTQNCGITSCNWTFSRFYTKNVIKPGIDGASSIATWLAGAMMCGKIPHAAASAACVAWVTINYAIAVVNINTAVARNACFVVRFQYIGIVSPINAFNTGWSNGEHCKNS